MRAKAKITAAVLALSFAVTSYAAIDIDAIHYDDTAVVAGSELVLNGAGMRKKVFFKVYAAGLYLPAKASDGSEVFGQKGAARVRLGLLRDVSASSFVSALEEGLKDNTDEKTRTEIASEIAALIEAMNKIGDVKEGDVVDFDFSGTATSVSVNGKPVADNLGGRRLFDAVLGIWLGKNAIDDKLKKGLLRQSK